jgi:hypothetical protein
MADALFEALQRRFPVDLAAMSNALFFITRRHCF